MFNRIPSRLLNVIGSCWPPIISPIAIGLQLADNPLMQQAAGSLTLTRTSR
jgi:hypothetical protein